MSDAYRESFRGGDRAALAAVDDLTFWAAPFGIALLDAVRLLPGLKALDIGCGMGFPVLELASRLGPGGAVTGLDPWKPALDRVAAKAKLRGVSNIQLVEGGAEVMPFEDRSFDLIVSNNGLNNVQDVPLALSECARIAKVGAQLVLTANLPDTVAFFYEQFEMLLEERGLRSEIEALHSHIRAKRKTSEEWQRLVEDAGFAIRTVREASFTWRFLNGTALFQHWFIRLAFLPPWTALLPPDQAQGFLASLEERLNRLAHGLPLEVPFLCLDGLRT